MSLILAKILSYFPRQLPVGATEFTIWSERIIALSGQFADSDSMKFALCSQIMHLGANKSAYPDIFFVRSMRKAAANQVAAQFFQDIKNKQLAAAEAAKNQLVEVTTPTPEAVTPNAQVQG